MLLIMVDQLKKSSWNDCENSTEAIPTLDDYDIESELNNNHRKKETD